jgi:hypothetical protein
VRVKAEYWRNWTKLGYIIRCLSDQRPDEVPVPREVVELARAGKKLEAIKRYRALTGLDHAKAALIDLWAQPL